METHLTEEIRKARVRAHAVKYWFHGNDVDLESRPEEPFQAMLWRFRRSPVSPTAFLLPLGFPLLHFFLGAYPFDLPLGSARRIIRHQN
jgi:hypothetical protein